jgi:hypothetical protein
MAPSKPYPWKQLGIAAARLADLAATQGQLTFLFETGIMVHKALGAFRGDEEGLDWNLHYATIYRGGADRVLRVDTGTEHAVLPQIGFFLPGPNFDARLVALESRHPTSGRGVACQMSWISIKQRHRKRYFLTETMHDC